MTLYSVIPNDLSVVDSGQLVHSMVDGPLVGTAAEYKKTFYLIKHVQITPSEEWTSTNLDLNILRCPHFPLLGSGPLDVWSQA